MSAANKFKEYGDFIQEAMQRFQVPGVAVGIVCDGQEYTAGFGVTNVNHPLPVDADTLFQIGSTSKTFTGTIIMRLVEMGKLKLDLPITNYLPDFRMKAADVTAHVTTRHLLTHTGGWLGDYFDDTGNGDDALTEYVRRMADLPQLTPLGTVWSYNNAGFSLAGRVIEAVTGQTYEAALKEFVFEPLNLSLSFIFLNDVMVHRFAVGHNVIDGKPQVAQPWALARSAHAAGAITATAKDQLKYARFHMSDGMMDGKQALSAETLRQMQTSIHKAALDDQMALSFFVFNVGGVRVVRHGGATNGQLSAFMFAPDHNFAITVLTNANRGAELNREATKFAFKHFLGVSEPEPTHVAMSETQLAEYVGSYDTALAGTELKLQAGQLVMHVTPRGGFPHKDSKPAGPPPPPSRLAFINTNRVIALDAPFNDVQGEFLRKSDERIEWFRFGGRIRAKER
jgi:CubicO group peptidase (beta-lactamase class C family)